MKENKKRIAIFASGEGSNAEAIAIHFENHTSIDVAMIVSNKQEAGVHRRISRFAIPSYIFDKSVWQSGEGKGNEVLALLDKEQIDLIVLAGFLAFIPNSIVNAYKGRIINIHPSLLPKYGGKGMWGHHVHEAVIDAHEEESGITIHHVTDKLDEGEIIFQASCNVLPDDTPDTLAARIHQLEHKHYPSVVEQMLS